MYQESEYRPKTIEYSIQLKKNEKIKIYEVPDFTFISSPFCMVAEGELTKGKIREYKEIINNISNNEHLEEKQKMDEELKQAIINSVDSCENKLRELLRINSGIMEERCKKENIEKFLQLTDFLLNIIKLNPKAKIYVNKINKEEEK